MKNIKRNINALFVASVILVIALFSLTLVACKTPEVQSYKITYATENALYGAVSGSCNSGEEVKSGTSVTLTATPEDECSFTGWYVGNTLKSNANPYTFSASEEISLVAKFEYVGHVCSFNTHVAYSIDEDLDNDTFTVYRTMKCSCGETQTAEFSDYVSVIDTAGLRNQLISTGVKNRLVVLENGWTYGQLELGLNHLDEGLTILARDGVTMSGLTIDSGKSLIEANAIEDVMASNVIIAGITFTRDLTVINCSIEGLTIKDCTFTEGSGINARANSFDGFDSPGDVGKRNEFQINKITDLTIESCVFSGSNNVNDFNNQKTKIYGFDVDGVTIRNCNISSCEYNAIQLNNKKLDGVYGNIIIEGNTISDTFSRAIRITNIMENLIVKDNVLSHIDTSGNDNGQIFKANSQSATTVITFTGNKLNGSIIEVNDPKVVWEHSVLEN